MAQTTLPLVASDLLHLRGAPIGLITAASGVVAVVTMSVVSSRIPLQWIRPSLVLALLVLAASFPLVGDARGPVSLTAGALVLGLAGGVVFPTLLTAVGGLGGEEVARGARDRPIALLSVALSTGLAFGPFVEGGVLSWSGGDLRAVFDWFAIGPVVGALALSGLVWARRRSRPAPARLPQPVPVPRAACSVPGDRVRVALPAALRDEGFQVALLGQLMYTAPFAAVVVFGALFARHADGMSLAGVEVAFGVFFVVSFGVRSAVAWRSPIAHKLAWFQLSAALTVAGLGLMALGRGEAALLAAMALLGVPHGLTYPLAMGMVAEGRPSAQLASVNAHLSAAVQVVNLVLAPLLGLGIDAIGYRVTFAALVVPVVVAALVQRRIGHRDGYGDGRSDGMGGTLGLGGRAASREVRRASAWTT
jgi:predicted MFS family arabinose efflux permease